MLCTSCFNNWSVSPAIHFQGMLWLWEVFFCSLVFARHRELTLNSETVLDVKTKHYLLPRTETTPRVHEDDFSKSSFSRKGLPGANSRLLENYSEPGVSRQRTSFAQRTSEGPMLWVKETDRGIGKSPAGLLVLNAQMFTSWPSPLLRVWEARCTQ